MRLSPDRRVVKTLPSKSTTNICIHLIKIFPYNFIPTFVVKRGKKSQKIKRVVCHNDFTVLKALLQNHKRTLLSKRFIPTAWNPLKVPTCKIAVWSCVVTYRSSSSMHEGFSCPDKIFQAFSITTLNLTTKSDPRVLVYWWRRFNPVTNVPSSRGQYSQVTSLSSERYFIVDLKKNVSPEYFCTWVWRHTKSRVDNPESAVRGF